MFSYYLYTVLLSITLTALPSLTGSVPLGTSFTIGVRRTSTFRARVIDGSKAVRRR